MPPPSPPPSPPQPTETSPLLGKPSAAQPNVPVDPGAGIAPEGPAPDGLAPQDAGDAGSDGADIERTLSAQDRAKQYEGLPEVRKRMIYIFPAMAIGVFLAAADQTLIVTSYGVIGTDLQALEKTSWIATAYFLTLTSFQPLYGKLSDIFSRKSCLLFGYTVFATGCLFCGLARNIYELVAARAFAGIGGSGMTTVVSIILSDAIPLQQRGVWQGYINIIYAAGASTGSAVGGILADSIGWRLSFLLQTPMCMVAFAAVSLLLHLPKPERAHWREKLGRIDFAGAALLIVATFCLLVGLDRGSNYAWKDVYTLVPLCLSLPLYGLFVLVEMRVALEPFAPGRVILERSALACFFCAFFSHAGWIAGMFYLSLFYQAVGGRSASAAGLLALPQIFFSVSGSLCGGWYMRKTGKFYWGIVIPYTTLAIGLVVILITSSARTVPLTLIGACICGFSNGFGITTSLIGLIANVARDDQAIATACSYLFRSLGSTTGVSLSAAGANQVLRVSLSNALGSGDEARRLEQAVRNSLGEIRLLKPALQQIVRQSYLYATRTAFSIQLCLLIGCAISAWFIRERPLNR